VNPEKSINWNKGISVFAFKNKWRTIIFILQKYVTCKGRYGLVFYYYIFLIINLFKGYELDMLFYLLHSLNKMALNIQQNPRSMEKSLYNYGLVQMLVEFKV
jgi:hypothetical protein